MSNSLSRSQNFYNVLASDSDSDQILENSSGSGNQGISFETELEGQQEIQSQRLTQQPFKQSAVSSEEADFNNYGNGAERDKDPSIAKKQGLSNQDEHHSAISEPLNSVRSLPEYDEALPFNKGKLIGSNTYNHSNTSSNNPDWVNMEFTDIGKSVFLNYPLSKDRKDLKISSIKTALSLHDANLLATLSVSREGLINNELRSKVWCFFLGIDDIDSIGKSGNNLLVFDHSLAEPHKDEAQVQLDINRSFSHYPKVKDPKNETIARLRVNLSQLIIKILRKYPNLAYYQGYHDIAQLVLLVFYNNLNKSFVFLERLTLLHLRDYMMPSINSSVHHLNLILLIIYQKDYNFFKILNNLKPFYSLSSIITLFTHDVSDYNSICYIFDYLLSNGTSVIYNSIYLYAEILLLNKNQILNLIFENIYNKINSNTESISGSYLSESDTLAESMLSNNSTNITEDSGTESDHKQDSATPPKFDRHDSSMSNTINLDSNHYDGSSITASQYQKTSSLSNSEFIGYDDNDIQLINFDYLHNILSHLISDFSNSSNSGTKAQEKHTSSSGKYFELFSKTNELMQNYPIFDKVDAIENFKIFERSNDEKYQLRIDISQYSVLKNTSKYATEPNITSLAAAQAIFDKQYEEAILEQKREKEEQLRQFNLLMKERKAKKAATEAEIKSVKKRNSSKNSNNSNNTNYFRMILYPLTNKNSQLFRYFKHYRFIKISVIIGIVSILVNIYAANNYSLRLYNLNIGYLGNLGNHVSRELFSFGRNFQAGIKVAVQNNSKQIGYIGEMFSIEHVKDSFHEFSNKVFS